jgi:hypothetical protein
MHFVINEFVGACLPAGYVQVVVPEPWLLLDCRQAGGQLRVLRPPPQQQQQQQQEGEEVQRQQQQEGEEMQRQQTARSEALQEGQQQQQEVLLWSIPAGNLDHLQLASWGTLLVAGACCAVLSARASQVMAAV